MDLNILKNLKAYGAGAFSRAVRLDFGNAFTSRNKSAQNQLISNNLLRKSTQLVNDLLSIRALKQGKNIEPLPVQPDPVAHSIDDILQIRESLNLKIQQRGTNLDKKI